MQQPQPKQQQAQQPSPMISMHDALSKDAVSTAESLSAMMHNERTTYKRHDYFHPPSPDPAAPPRERQEDGNNVPQEVPQDQDAHQEATTMTMVNENDRLQIVDWCYSVVDQCNFDRETVAIAMDMMDRFLSLSCSSSSTRSTNNANGVNPYSRIAHTALHNRKSFQLLSMSALYSAIKMNETVALGATFFSAMSRGTYTVKDIEGMELTLLNGLGWRCCAPTGIQMAHHILSLLLPHLTKNDEQRSDGGDNDSPDEAMWGFILDEIRFQTESAVRASYFTSKRPSTIAMAAIFNALTQIPKRVRQAFLRALLVLMNNREFMFDSPQELLNGRNRLKCFIEGNTSNHANVAAAAVQDHHHHHGAAGDRNNDREDYYRDQREQDDIIALAPVIHQPFAHVAQPPLVPQVIEDFDDDDDDDSSLSSCSDSEVEQAAATMSSSSLKRVRSSDDDDDDDDSSTTTTDDHEETPRRKAARIDNGRVAETSLTRTVTPTDSFRGNRKQSFPN